MNDEAKLPNAPDIGDYLKVFACTAVMLQTILGLALQTHPSLAVQAGIGITYNLIKFTAPAFIVGILYTTIRVTGGTNLTYHGYLGQMWHSLFVPTILWTAIYLLAMPGFNRSATTIPQFSLLGSLLMATLHPTFGTTR